MTNILMQKLESNISSWAKASFRERSFFETVALLFMAAIIIQLYAQYYSFQSECEFISKAITMEVTAGYKTYMLAIIFELAKATIVAMSIIAFLKEGGILAIMLPLSIGLGLSYASWWMSNEGTAYQADAVMGFAPVDDKTDNIGSAFQSQIDDIDNEISDLEQTHFYWCPDHAQYNGRGRAHKCDSPSNNRHVNRKDKGDRQAEARIAELKEKKDILQTQMASSILMATTTHSQLVADHNAAKNKFHSTLEDKVLIAELITWVCLIFITYVKFKLATLTVPDRTLTVPNGTLTVPNGTLTVPNGTQTVRKKKNTLDDFTEEELEEGGLALELVAKENAQLRAELAAMKESGK